VADVNPAGWRKALASYDYQVDFSGFPHDPGCEGPPKTKFSSRADTVDFESYFRRTGTAQLCPWFEVIYWKMFSQGKYRRMLQVNERMAYWNDRSVPPGNLWKACKAYTDEPCKGTFRGFLKLFGFTIEPLAIAATFPAFVNPDDFPMVDTRVAKWVIEFGAEHNAADPAGAQLRQPEAFARGSTTVLTMLDFDFMLAWTEWCHYTAGKLSKLSQPSVKWRARDVEMAVFRAWGNRHPVDSIRLEPLPAFKRTE
jgi:hypothetical protein